MFVGKVMKATSGKADGKAVTALLSARREAART
jgi:Asp-tRNA(Asn)/Glu-tRNA(Gln) amidotransferase B subunit